MTEVPPGFPKLKGESKPWKCRKADPACARTTPCPSCRGARNRRSGMRKQREARKTLERLTGTEAAKFVGQLGNEEAWSGLPLRAEVKSGAQVGPIWTRYLAAETQAETSRALGDVRPFVMVAMGKGVTDGLVLCRLSQLAALIDVLVAKGAE